MRGGEKFQGINGLRELAAKYDAQGPRYTSYPTAPHFSPECDRDSLVRRAVESAAPRSLYIHIPFCRSICFFCGCSSSVCLDPAKADAYLGLLKRELELWRDSGLGRCALGQAHFGGGTPNFLEPGQITGLSEIIGEFFDFESGCEFSTELDPRTLTREKVEAFAKIGVNRASIGIQDTNPDVQKAINRVQPQSVNLESVAALRECGIMRINVDVIYGLPLQTPQKFEKTLDDCLALKPDRIALFNYAHVPWIKSAQRAMEKFPIPHGDEKLALFSLAMERFEDAGFEYIGLDHFARPKDELMEARKNGTLQRNFQGYSTRAGLESFGIGLTSISQTRDSYRQNRKIQAEYEGSLAAGRLPVERGIVLADEDILRREVIMDVMCLLNVDFGKFESKYGIDFRKKFAAAFPALENMQKDGLLEMRSGGFGVSPLGRLFLRNIAMLFDGYLPTDSARYSKTL